KLNEVSEIDSASSVSCVERSHSVNSNNRSPILSSLLPCRPRRKRADGRMRCPCRVNNGYRELHSPTRRENVCASIRYDALQIGVGRLARGDTVLALRGEAWAGCGYVGAHQGVALVAGVLEAFVALIPPPREIHFEGRGQHHRILDPC